MSSVRVTMTSSTGTFATVVVVPSNPVEAMDVIPALHALDDWLVSEAVAAIDREGRRITCRFGCTACCYQMVPVTETEARFLNKIVDSLPADEREVVHSGAAEAVRCLEVGGLLPALGRIDRLSRSELGALAIRYFRMQIPCPFLDGESCSIYGQRPLACREYLVTSPRERCEHFGEEIVERVPLPTSLFSHLTRNGRTRRELLVLSLDRTDHYPGSDRPLPGSVHLARLLDSG